MPTHMALGIHKLHNAVRSPRNCLNASQTLSRQLLARLNLCLLLLHMSTTQDATVVAAQLSSRLFGRNSLSGRRVFEAVIKWCTLRWCKVANVEELVRQLCVLLAGQRDSLVFDPVRQCVEVFEPTLVIALTQQECCALNRVINHNTSWTPSPRPRNAFEQFDRQHVQRVPAVLSDAFFSALDRAVVALHIFAALEVLLGHNRRLKCENGFLACPIVSEITALRPEACSQQCPVPQSRGTKALVEVSALLWRHRCACHSWSNVFQQTRECDGAPPQRPQPKRARNNPNAERRSR